MFGNGKGIECPIDTNEQKKHIFDNYAILIDVPRALVADTGTSTTGRKMVYVQDSTGLYFYMEIQFEEHFPKNKQEDLSSTLLMNEIDSCTICERNIKYEKTPFLSDTLHRITNILDTDLGPFGYNNYIIYFDSERKRTIYIYFLGDSNNSKGDRMCWFQSIVASIKFTK